MKLDPKDAHLLLIMLNKSDASAIRPGEFSGEQALEMVERLRKLAQTENSSCVFLT